MTPNARGERSPARMASRRIALMAVRPPAAHPSERGDRAVEAVVDHRPAQCATARLHHPEQRRSDAGAVRQKATSRRCCCRTAGSPRPGAGWPWRDSGSGRIARQPLCDPAAFGTNDRTLRNTSRRLEARRTRGRCSRRDSTRRMGDWPGRLRAAQETGAQGSGPAPTRATARWEVPRALQRNRAPRRCQCSTPQCRTRVLCPPADSESCRHP